MSTLQFAPWSSDLDLAFYSALASRKINHDKLDDAARKIVGRYELRATDLPDHSARMQFPGNALRTDEYVLATRLQNVADALQVSWRDSTVQKVF